MTDTIIQPAPTATSHIRVDDALVPRNQALRHLNAAQERVLLEAERRGWLPLRLARIYFEEHSDREELLQYAARDLLEHADPSARPPTKGRWSDPKEATPSYLENSGVAVPAPTPAMWQEPAAKRTERIEKNQEALMEARTIIDHATTQLYADHPVNILLRQAIAELAKVELG